MHKLMYAYTYMKAQICPNTQTRCKHTTRIHIYIWTNTYIYIHKIHTCMCRCLLAYTYIYRDASDG